MVPNLTLRPYQESDFETLLRIDHACFPKGIAYGRFELRVYLNSPGAFCLIAEEGAETAGFILIETSAVKSHIITIDVLESYRKHGIGTLLLAAAESRAAKQGAPRMNLESATTNKPAIAFWHKHGYRESGIIKDYYGRGQDAFAMSKCIGATDTRG